MIDVLSFVLAAGCLAGATVLAARLTRRQFRWPVAVPILIVIEAGLAIQLILDVVGLIGGHRPGEPATHLAYAITSVLPLPAAAAQARGDDGVWAGLVLVVALAVVAVLVIRMQATWRSA